MLQLEKILSLKDTKLIVIDEDVNSMNAHCLLLGWLNIYKEIDPDKVFKILSFSNHKRWYTNKPEFHKSFEIQDYYTTEIDKESENDLRKLQDITNIIGNNGVKKTIILDNLNNLLLQVGFSNALHFIKKLSKQSIQLICIYQRDFTCNKIPQIGTLGTTYIKLESLGNCINEVNTYTAKIVHRKLEGLIQSRIELVNQDLLSYKLDCKKLVRTQNKNQVTETKGNDKIKSSFRIEMSEHEMEQREKTVLPYTAITNVVNTSKIIYQPDEVDDIDEDDPDDDLCF